MTVGELISVIFAIFLVVNIYIGYKKEGGDFADYALGRGFIPWAVFAFKAMYIVGVLVYFYNKINVNWDFLNYKLW